ncbi:putative oxoglutarate/iron-dependent dioxygenase, non-heme dioxygenase domain-containing protein [Helianthus annuus]|uniref:Oxoglutarate/iron-dependent dioxygenase, non-heme dioxygenase domain-containing protein n=2 Tax=Helianthus annuus TaxID=4232 RepID=A0A9K3J935_HELAN|nr:hyoscyamine 6-dioxygenase [Helianthus annuus]KAF5810571.1 putative oxoglutarate/iron-dependent dioxygenase, non-heme dioxygenase domain-containing protein [Helianthus annuus]KAJ0589311.1 putative oxoglutarate/iron-dependent dioxygenase, non-heme dioxygenase domain-containing protein [Helianthus annuus]KAJ0597316.1 putative oxoglutarate/iron-dependent dioxygenase, non-heme dioxygenase domain-containing protein [Helianthus annuus]KAJ0927259.1 putative oxoglutarate/iron-dependent dioxygenase, n
MKEDKGARWFELECVPKEYIFPTEYRPQNLESPVCDSIPVISLANSKAENGHSQPVEEILKASQELGFFQVINHGIPEKTVTDAMNVLKEFFDMQVKDTTTETVPRKKGYIYTNSTDFAKDGVHLWRENFKHPCHPLEECIHLWPDTPTRYQEVIAAYIVEIQKLSTRILEMICEGLGLEQGYFKDTSEVQFLSSNFYPPCPDPSLTLGILPHVDPSLITILYQGGSTGLQVIKDGQWVNVGAIPNAFVVNIGNQLEIISNWKFKSAKHRVVTSTHETRRSIATFVNPSPNCIIEPAKNLVNELEPTLYKASQNLVNELEPALYKPSQYKEYVLHSNAFGDDTAAIQNGLR